MTLLEIFIAAEIILIFGVTPLLHPNVQHVPLVAALLMAGMGLAGFVGMVAAFAAFIWLEIREEKE
jgi:hypothetical protein